MSSYRNSFDFISALQYENKNLKRKVAAFESGEIYVSMQKAHDRLCREQRNTINHQKKEISDAHKETLRVRKMFWDMYDDLLDDFEKYLEAKDRECARRIAEIEKECAKKLAAKEREKEAMRKERDAALEREKKAKEKRSEKQQELYAVQTELENERELNRKLTAQINKDFQTSSIPSSMQTGCRKKIPNSRVKTERKPGAQKGHEPHTRKKLTPTETRELSAPANILENPDYVETGNIISRQRISVELKVNVEELTTKEYKNVKTGKTWHASFPAGFENDVNYDGSVKAMLYHLSTECNVSHDKVIGFVKMLSKGKLCVSKGMVNKLLKEFSDKSQKEQTEAAEELMKSPVMNVDFTNANVNGEYRQVLILGTPDNQHAKLIARACKGHAGVQGTLLAVYTGIVCHDHDTTWYSYGLGHQECMHHNYRYLKGNVEAEPEYPWGDDMRKLFLSMTSYRNSLPEGEEMPPEKIAYFEQRYDEILEEAAKQFADNPPGKYNRESLKMYNRLRDYKESELLFLHDRRVPDNNDLAERLARVFKRKQRQATVFRSDASLIYVCNGLSVLHDLKAQGKDLFEEMTGIFNRPQPPKDSIPEPVLVKPVEVNGDSSDGSDQEGDTSGKKKNEVDTAA